MRDIIRLQQNRHGMQPLINQTRKARTIHCIAHDTQPLIELSLAHIQELSNYLETTVDQTQDSKSLKTTIQVAHESLTSITQSLSQLALYMEQVMQEAKAFNIPKD